MEDIIPLVGILTPFIFVLVMVKMILAHKERRRQESRGIAGEATAADADLAALAERMERRIDALEQILDAEAPGWRKKYEHS